MSKSLFGSAVSYEKAAMSCRKDVSVVKKL